MLATAIEQYQPTKKMSLIRGLMPNINNAKQRGLSKKEIWESLYGAGLDISYSTFLTYLSRIENQNRAPAETPGTLADPTFCTPKTPNLDTGGRVHRTRTVYEVIEDARRSTERKDYSKIMREHIKASAKKG